LDPQQELFTALRLRLEALGCRVYDGALPPERTLYPFIYLADSSMLDDPNKSAIFGTVFQTVHIWHNRPDRRGKLSDLLSKVKAICRQLDYTASYAWDLRQVDQRILTDTTTKTPLLHGVLELEFKFCGR